MKASKPANALKKAPFTLKVAEGDEHDAVKAGDTLTTIVHVGEHLRYFALAFAEDDEAVYERIEKATADQIVTAANIEIDTTSDVTPQQQRIDAILASPLGQGDTGEVPTMDRIRINASSPAATWGAKLPDSVDEHIVLSIKGERDRDAGLLLTAMDFMQFGKDNPDWLKDMPVIGTRNRKRAKKNVVPWGYRSSTDSFADPKLPVYNGPWDYGETENHSNTGPDTIPTNYVAELVASKANKWTTLYQACTAALKDKASLDTAWPAEVQALFKESNRPKLIALQGEAQQQHGKRETVARKALKLMQKWNAFEKRFTHIKLGVYGVDLEDEDAETAARRTKPLYAIQTLKNGQAVTIGPFKATTISNHEPAKYPPNALWATLMQPTEAELKAREDAKNKAKQVPAAVAKFPVTNVFDLRDVCLASSAYFSSGEKYEMIRQQLNKPDGGMLASAMNQMLGYLQELKDDFIVKAKDYDDEQAEAVRAADKAKAEAKKKAA